jgi:hypothetical protein
VKYPFHVHAHMGDHPLIAGGHNYLDLRAQDVKVNVADAAQAVPDAVRSAPLPTQTNVASTQLAPGVVLIGGGSHNSVAVEFKDYVTVIEGPLSNQRTNAVVAEVHKLFPNKPIRYLVNTHNHFDHLGGVRGFVAEGATVITDDRNRNFYTRVVLAPQSRTIGYRNGPLRRPVRERWNCRRSPTTTRSAMAIRSSSSIMSMISTTATTWRSSISPRIRS